MTILNIKHPLVIIVILFLFTRLTNLTLLPVFSDEALYIDWGWQTTHIPNKLWHPLTDAKQPFLIWLFGLSSSLLPDPLFGARIISVIAGFLSLLGIWEIGKRFFNIQTAIFATLAYCLIPIFVFFDRQALMESSIVATTIWSLLFLLKLITTKKIKYTYLLGISLGIGLFIKNTMYIFILCSLFIITLQIFIQKKNSYFFSLSIIITSIVLITINLPLFFQPLYWQTLTTNSRWTFTFSELLKFPIYQWLHNIFGNTQIAFIYLTPPFFVYTLLAIRKSLYSNIYVLKTILLWTLLPLLFYLGSLKFTNFMAFRYLTPFLTPFLFYVSFYFPKKLLLFIPGIYSLILIFNPVKFFEIDAKINNLSYKDGYLTGYDTGYQVNNLVEYFTNLSKTQPIVVTTAVHTFNPESGVWIYLRKNPNITMAYLDGRLYANQLADIDCIKTEIPTFFIAKLNNTEKMEKYFELETTITNQHNQDFSTIYKIKNQCSGRTVKLTL